VVVLVPSAQRLGRVFSVTMMGVRTVPVSAVCLVPAARAADVLGLCRGHRRHDLKLTSKPPRKPATSGAPLAILWSSRRQAR
jgi:hypothetical protein